MAEKRAGAFIDPKERIIAALERIAAALEASLPSKYDWPDVGVEYPISRKIKQPRRKKVNA